MCASRWSFTKKKQKINLPRLASMDGSLIFVCLVVKTKSSAFNEDIEGEELYGLSC